MRVSLDQIQRLDMREGSEVEVCYQENGFKGIWYEAIIKEMRKSTRLRQVSVQLLKDGSSTPLTQLSGNVLVRPRPPHHLQARIDIKEGCVVEALHKNGWWTGFVIKEIDDDKCFVFFGSPPDIIKFQRKHLRPHLDWVDKKWWLVPVPKIQLLRRLTEESIFSSGTMVEVSCKTDKMESVWVPAMIIKEIEDDDEKKYIVKFCNKSSSSKGNKANVTVVSQSVRPKPPPFLVEEYKLLDCVEAFRGSKWRKGIVKQIISPKRYKVYFEATKKQLKFNYADLRHPMEWEDGVWKSKDSPFAEGSGNKMGGSVMNGNTPSLANEAVAPVTLSPVINSTPLKQTEAETQGKTFPKKKLQPKKNQNGLGNDSTQEKGKPEKETPSDGKRNKSVALETRNVQTKEPPLAKGSGNEMTDGVLNGYTLVIMPQVDSLNPCLFLRHETDLTSLCFLAKQSGTSGITATPTKQTEDKAQRKTTHERTLEPMRNGNGLGNESAVEKMPEGNNSEDDSRKRKRGELEHNSDLNEAVSESVSPVTPSPVIAAIPLKQTKAGTQEKTLPKNTIQPMRDQNDLGNASTREKESTKDNNRKRKREQYLSSVANVEETRAKDSTKILPFEKKSPIWKTVESMEVFKTVPQSPHFSPLVETIESSREMSAVGMMLTYSMLLEEVKDLKLFNPISTLRSLSDSFTELEKHGFDVKAAQSRIQRLLYLKDRQAKKMEELEGAEKEIAENESEKVEIEKKILELQRRKEEADKEIARLKSCAATIGQQLEDVELQFQTTASVPW